jgi:hypothetical protein
LSTLLSELHVVMTLVVEFGPLRECVLAGVCASLYSIPHLETT